MLGAAAQAAAACDLPRFGNVSVLHLTDGHAKRTPTLVGAQGNLGTA